MDLHLRVVVYEPGKPGEVRAILDSVKSIQEIVGGYFECVLDQLSGLHLYINEDGVRQGLPPNRMFGIWEVVGPAVFTQHDEEGEAAGLTDDDIDMLRVLYG